MPPPGSQQELTQARALIDQGRFTEAEQICRRVLKRDSKDVGALHHLAFLESQRGNTDHSIAWHRKALKLRPNEPRLHCGLGRELSRRGLYDQALASFERTLALEGNHPEATAAKADTLDRLGRTDEAVTFLEPIMQRGGEDAQIALFWAAILQRENKHDDAIELLNRHINDDTLPDATVRKLLFLLVPSYEAVGAYDAAFAVLNRANALLRKPFSIDSVRAWFDRLKDMFSADNFRKLPRSSNDSEVPVFVISMPRCGSTLIEQILASHPDVHGAGETDELMTLERSLVPAARSEVVFPDTLDSLNQRSLDRLSHRYLGRMRQLDRAALRITNKHLRNAMYLGFIAMLFPKARVIYSSRDPIAMGLSCYRLDLSPVTTPFAGDLTSLGQYYVEFDRLMRHWRAVLDIPMFDMTYEGLVADQEGVTRQMVGFLGLPWDERCLSFHQTAREVATPSFEQVRRPIYTSAAERHHHYEKHLAPLRAALGDLATNTRA